MEVSTLLQDILTSVIGPIIVGIVLKLFDEWLSHRHNDKKK
ncbi:type I toxin-antitoxin system Fst family toxin [Lactobacillus colini]|nr:type I toxin-antitoxin system Fst family toxin [Lactobacillus colini]